MTGAIKSIGATRSPAADRQPVWFEREQNKKEKEQNAKGEPSGLSDAGPFTSNPYELIVIGECCSFTKPVRTASYTRFRTYKALAKWLTDNRDSFLESRDWWDLGPKDASELDQGCSVVQQDLLRMLALNDEVEMKASSFSRFLDECELVWPDGVASIRILFSPEAKLAWVARAMAPFLPKSGGPITVKTLKRLYATVPVRGNPLNKTVHIRCEDVLEQYRGRMLRPQGNGPSTDSASTDASSS